MKRAAERLARLQQGNELRDRKSVREAVEAFIAQHADTSTETQRKYGRILRYLREYLDGAGITAIEKVTLASLDNYVAARRKPNWTWRKELEILRQFFGFCEKRQWCGDNPAADIKLPRLEENDDIVPYSQQEIVQIIRACGDFGKTPYERLRARAMVLLMRHTGMRISDVVTLSREHIKGRHLEKRAIKNRRMIRVEVPQVVTDALNMLPHPKAAAKDSRFYFASGSASIRSLVKGAERTLSAVFKRAGVLNAYPHKFRHTLASELLGKGESIEMVASILADTPAIVSRHYAKWTPELQTRQDQAIRKIHDTNLAQAEELVIA
jgi:integrase/recombinase XerD